MDAAHARLSPVEGDSRDAVPIVTGSSAGAQAGLMSRCQEGQIRMRYNSVHGYHFFGRCSRKSLEDRGVRNDYS